MTALNVILYTVHVLISIFLVLVVLLQQGKGADLSVFGGGSTQAAFGARGAATLLHKLTVAGFVLFTVTTLTIALIEGQSSRDSVMGSVPAAQEEKAPPAPAVTPEAPAGTTPPPGEPAPAPESVPAPQEGGGAQGGEDAQAGDEEPPPPGTSSLPDSSPDQP